MTSAPASPRGTDYAALSRLVRQSGLLDRRPRYYAWKITLTAAAFAAGWAAFAVIGNSWWQLADAVFLAGVFGQFGFLGHDAGHSQVFRTRRANAVLGLACGNLGAGISYEWWTGKHNRHHAHPNTEGADPDIAIGALAFSPAGAQAARGIRRLVYRYQAYLVIPMLFLEALSLHASSIRRMTRPGCRHRASEATLLGMHFAAYLGLVFFVLPPVKAVTFIAVQQGLFGFYLGCSFAPNHKGMPILAASDQTDFLRRQVLTSRNVRGGWLTDFALGGLNYQIEHHLFPSMPRPSLRRAQPLVAAFCAERDVSYTQTSLLASYAQALGHLAAVGSNLASRVPAAGITPVPARRLARPARRAASAVSRPGTREPGIAAPGEPGVLAPEKGEQVTDGQAPVGRLGHREVRLHPVAVPAAALLLDDVTGLGEVTDDPERAALGDADRRGDIA
jgi:fatty acid desaturase